MSAHWLRLALLVPIMALTGGAAEEKPPTARQRLGSALKVTHELFHDGAPDNRFSAHEQYLFPRRSHIRTYFQARRWEAEAMIPFDVLKTSSAWPTAGDAAELHALLHDQDPQFKALAASALASLHQPDDIPRIAELLSDQRLGAPRLERALLSLPLRLHQGGQADEVDCSLWWQQRAPVATRPVPGRFQSFVERCRNRRPAQPLSKIRFSAADLACGPRLTLGKPQRSSDGSWTGFCRTTTSVTESRPPMVIRPGDRGSRPSSSSPAAPALPQPEALRGCSAGPVAEAGDEGQCPIPAIRGFGRPAWPVPRRAPYPREAVRARNR